MKNPPSRKLYHSVRRRIEKSKLNFQKFKNINFNKKKKAIEEREKNFKDHFRKD